MEDRRRIKGKGTALCGQSFFALWCEQENEAKLLLCISNSPVALLPTCLLMPTNLMSTRCAIYVGMEIYHISCALSIDHLALESTFVTQQARTSATTNVSNDKTLAAAHEAKTGHLKATGTSV